MNVDQTIERWGNLQIGKYERHEAVNSQLFQKKGPATIYRVITDRGEHLLLAYPNYMVHIASKAFDSNEIELNKSNFLMKLKTKMVKPLFVCTQSK